VTESSKEKTGFFDLKRNLIGLVVLAAVVAGLAWMVGIKPGDYGQVAEEIMQSELPDLPLSIKTRGALLGTGTVVAITNQGQEALELTATMVSYDETSRKQIQFKLAPLQAKNIGVLEGWEFVPGDNFSFAANGYKTSRFTIQR